MKPNLILFLSFLYSAFLIPLWGFAFLSLDTANSYTVFLGLLFTFYFSLLIPKVSEKKVIQHILLLSGPVFYVCVGIYAQRINLFISPIFWAFVLFLAVLYLPKRTPIVHAAVLAYAAFCAFAFYLIRHDYAVEDEEPEPIVEINENLNLSDFAFLSKNDTVKIVADKAILIETWNETCQPCMASIKDLQAEFSRDSTFKYVYLYQNRGKAKLSQQEIFNFSAIEDKNNIHIDLQNRLFKEMKLVGYPFFLVFNKSGKLVGYQFGYNPNKKEETVKKLCLLLEKAKMSS